MVTGYRDLLPRQGGTIGAFLFMYDVSLSRCKLDTLIVSGFTHCPGARHPALSLDSAPTPTTPASLPV